MAAKTNMATLTNSFKHFIFDCDGVIWRQNSVIPGALSTINELYAKHKTIVFLSNNSTQTQAQYVHKFHKMGFEHIKPASIYPTSTLTAKYLSSNKPNFKKIFFATSQATIDEVKCHFPSVEIISFDSQFLQASLSMNMEDISNMSIAANLDAVVVGLHSHFSYYSLCYAALATQQGATLIATNTDALFPTQQNSFIPGAGSLVAAFETACRMKAEVIGKPNPFCLDAIFHDHNIHDLNECVIVGDRLETDIAIGKRVGVKTVLVMTGVSQFDDIARTKITPDYIMPSIASSFW